MISDAPRQTSQPRAASGANGASGAWAHLLQLRRTREEDAAWALLRADHAPLIVSVLGRHLAGDVRRIPAEDLIEMVDSDLDELRSHGETLPQTARRYCADWRTHGWLIARPSTVARGETYELSDGALRAIQMAGAMSAPRSSVTQSRLAAISDQLTGLSVDTDPDRSRQLATLTAQRDALDQRIARVQQGEEGPLSHREAAERLQDILTQAAELPSDFGRVRSRFEELSTTLRERVLESDSTQRRVLDEIFRGVDLIGDSEEGRSFAQFLRLVLDPEAGAAFDADVDQVLERAFTVDLDPADRRFLRRFRSLLKREGKYIQASIAGFSRGLRRYVQSQEFQRDRALREHLRAALTEGLAAAPYTRPYRATDVELQLSGVPMAGVGALNLWDPAAMEASQDVAPIPPAEISFEDLRALARETEIDVDELRAHLTDTLSRINPASVGQILGEHPASQGVASLIGLLSLAMDAIPSGAAARVTDPAASAPHDEHVSWDALDGTTHHATIPLFRFTRTPLD